MKTKGETGHYYLYTADAATAILKGDTGLAYNAANESTYCSIAEMAEKVAVQDGIKVRYEIEDEIYAFAGCLALCRGHGRHFP